MEILSFNDPDGRRRRQALCAGCYQVASRLARAPVKKVPPSWWEAVVRELNLLLGDAIDGVDLCIRSLGRLYRRTPVGFWVLALSLALVVAKFGLWESAMIYLCWLGGFMLASAGDRARKARKARP